MIQEWNKVLAPTLKRIQETHFNENWFLEINEKKLTFGDKGGIRFDFHPMSAHYVMVYAFPFDTPKEIRDSVMDLLEEGIKEDNLDVLLSGSKRIATGERSMYVKEMLDYLSENMFQDRSLRLPMLSVFPQLEWEKSVYIVHENKDVIETIETMEQAKAFCEREQKEEKKMKEMEHQLQQWIVEQEPNVCVRQLNSYEETPTFLSDFFLTKYSFSKKIINQKMMFHASCIMDNEYKTIQDESLEMVLAQTKKDIQEFVKKSIS